MFWHTIADSTNPAEFEACLRRFPNGTFGDLAQIRLEALRAEPVSAGRPAGGAGSPAAGSRASGSLHLGGLGGVSPPATSPMASPAGGGPGARRAGRAPESCHSQLLVDVCLA